ncbi:YraN family protein [Utexia brackfieldae]|uniref:YraN family protein n=1 Tax=Utexia brackfieldae TaxID=3074108 RepID=UPI00370D8CD3
MQAKGLLLVARNYSCQVGEIDLIMRDGEYWVFIEVRYRHLAHYGEAGATIDQRKQRKIVLTAISWLQAQYINIEEVACRFDVFAITGNKIDWIIDAFGQDSLFDGS